MECFDGTKVSKDAPAVVFDNGTSTTKVGMAYQKGDPKLFDSFPTIYGKAKELAAMETVAKADMERVGKAAQEDRGILALSYPIENGIIKDFEVMEKIWRHSFINILREEGVAKEHPVFLTEPSQNPKKTRAKIAEVMFETFEVPALDIGDANVCALTAYDGKTTQAGTGVTVDMGAGTTMVVPIVKGYVIAAGIKRLNFAGQDFTKYLKELLSERSDDMLAAGDLDTPSGLEIVREIKEKILDEGPHSGKSMLYVAEDFQIEMDEAAANDDRNADYELPDGQEITIENERFRCPEGLFNPKMMGKKDVDPLPKSIFDSINACEQDIRRVLYSNIVLSGGTSSFDGLPSRLDHEIELLAPHLKKAKAKGKDMVSVKSGKDIGEDCRNVAWKGAALIAGSQTQRDKWMSKKEYQDKGADHINTKVLAATDFS
jgi:actin-related protein